jgi:acetoin utilization deacetylase AcuC-like enzyme
LDLASIPGIESIPFAPANAQELTRVHSASMLAQLQAVCLEGPGIIDHAPTYVTVDSYHSALQAVGATLAVTRAVFQGNARNGFAIVRPPGHHAEPDLPMGFCLLNNAAIAAQDALQGGVERVLVVDYDAHHGNGTQKALWNNPRAGYFSTHQENIYPGSGGLHDAPHARGRIANFPLPAYSGDRCFSLLFEQNLFPLARAFKPELLIVSAGFDAHWTDPLTSLGLTTAGYQAISKMLVELAQEICGGKIIFVLEGGYDPKNVAQGIQAVFAALTGNQSPQVNDLSKHPEPDINARMKAFQAWHRL